MNKLLSRAMFLLARRDYSEHELRRKLATPPAFPSKQKRTKSSKTSSFRSSSSNQCDEQQDDESSSTPLFQNPRHINVIDENEIESVIQYCYEHNWLNDTKFAASFIWSYANRGYGPRRIQLELQKKGINKDLIASSLMECEIDWQEFTHQALIKHFKPPFFSDWKSKSKVINYLMYKGFHSEDINDVLRALSE